MDLSKVVLGATQSSTVGIADRAKRLAEEGMSILNFSAGRSFEPTPGYIVEAAVDAARSGDTHQTMARGTSQFRNAVTRKLKRDHNITSDPQKEIIATGGVKQGLTIALLSILNPGDEVIVEDPCFVSYKQLITFFGGKVVEVPLRKENGFRWDPNELNQSVTTKTKAILFNSPHNPTGTVHSNRDLEAIAKIAIDHNLFILSDEVYERCVWGDREHICIASLPGMQDKTISINSLTKGYSMGGWRIGYIYAPARIIDQMEKLQQHLITSCNSFVQAGAAKAFGDPPGKEVIQNWMEWEKKCAFVTDGLNNVPGLSVQMPEGGFYAWVDISALNMLSEDFTSRLLNDHGVALIPGSSFGDQGNSYFRMTCVKSWDDIKAGLHRISKFVNKLH